MTEGRLSRISGSLAEASGLGGAALYELGRVGERGLLAEVIRIDADRATLQVYEETSGLSVGEPVALTGESLTVELGPGLLGQVLDGVGRPLGRLAERTGDFIAPGASAVTLDRERRFDFTPAVGLEVGATVAPGDVLGTVEERAGLVHRILVPPEGGGVLAEIRAGAYTVTEPFGRLADGSALTMLSRWPVRRPRPFARRLAADRPFVTGQRLLDFLFPVAEGGSVAVAGGFGTGKTVIEQSLAKFGQADVVVFIGCGERGNEMAELLDEFPRLVDPRTGRSLMDRTVLVVNTSNMPVAAREASVYLGLSIAEYYRDQGWRVAVLADSLSRWAEALREIAARLGEMPGEEGYPTYLSNRLGQIYERAGRVVALGAPERTGAVTFISAISPPGGDLSEPVTQASLRVAGGFWALSATLAHQRQFPAVDWDVSYSMYVEPTGAWFAREAGADWAALRRATLERLQREGELREIAGLVGADALQDKDRLLLESMRLVREIVLGQNVYDPNDAVSSIAKTHDLAALAHALHEAALAALERGTSLDDLELELDPARKALAALRSAPAAEFDRSARKAAAAIEALGAPNAGPREVRP